MEYQPEIAHQILEGLETFEELSTPILASRYSASSVRTEISDSLTDEDSWAGSIRYDRFVAHCTWLAEDGLVVPWVPGTTNFLLHNPTGQVQPYGYAEGYTQSQRLTAAVHRYLESIRNKGGLVYAIKGAAEEVGREAASIGFRTLLQHVGMP